MQDLSAGARLVALIDIAILLQSPPGAITCSPGRHIPRPHCEPLLQLSMRHERDGVAESAVHLRAGPEPFAGSELTHQPTRVLHVKRSDLTSRRLVQEREAPGLFRFSAVFVE